MKFSLKLVMGKKIVAYLIFALVAYGLIYYFYLRAGNGPEKQELLGEGRMRASLASQIESGESGLAILTQKNGKTNVYLSLSGYPNNVVQPAHIHVGGCPGLVEVKYPLNSVVNGKSETTLDVSISKIESELPLSIDVHKSESSPKKAVCGELK